MEEHLFLESYGPGAEARLARLIRQTKQSDPLAPVTVVVPTQYAGLALRRSLATSHGLVNVRFMILARLVEYLGAPIIASRGQVPLSPLVHLAAIRVTADHLPADGPLAPVARHPALQTALRTTFSQLGRLTDNGLALVKQADALRADIVGWYRLTREHLAGYYEREALTWAAATAVSEGQVAATLRDLGFVVVFLVPDLSHSERALIAALGRLGRCAVVLGLVGQGEADDPVRRAAVNLEPALGPAVAGQPPLATGMQAQHITSAPDAREEIRWVLRDILRRAGQGTPFHQIAVLYRQPDPYAFLVPSQFVLAGIPVAGPDPTPLRETPAGKLLDLLLQAIAGDFRREDVMRWPAEAPVAAATAGPDVDELATWEALSRQAGVVAGAAQWDERLRSYQEALTARLEALEVLGESTPAAQRGWEHQVAAVDRLRSFVAGLAAQVPPASGSSWQRWAAWAAGLLRHYALPPERWPIQHQGSFERLLTLLDDLADIDAVMPGPDLAAFRLMLDDALAGPAGRTGLTGSGVFVAPVAAAQGMAFAAVYLVGMAEGAFPPRLTEDPLLPDNVRATVPEEGLAVRQGRRAEERRLFVAALAAGQERTLTFPRSDGSAQRGQYPSPWLLEHAAHLYGNTVSAADLFQLGQQPWLTVLHSPQHALETAQALAPADVHDYDLASIVRWHAAGGRLEEHYLAGDGGLLWRALQMEKGHQSQDFTVWDGQVSTVAGKSIRLALPGDGALSPTRLERWAVCPFRYFLGDVLGLAALDRPEELLVISPLERGTLVHRILEGFVRAATDQSILPDFGEPWHARHRALLLEIAEAEFRRAETLGITGKHLLWEAAKAEILQDLWAFLEEDSRWRAELGTRPLWVERSFGLSGPESAPAVTVTLPGGGQVRFRGVIDRVDLDAAGARAMVLDYKTGSAAPYRGMKDDSLGGGRHLQLPVYALAVKAALGEATALEAHYWFVTARGNFERRTIALETVEARFLEVVGATAAGIQGGLFPAHPGPPGQDGPEHCRYCDFDRICPANRDLLWERKRGHPDLAFYVALSGEAGREQEGEE